MMLALSDQYLALIQFLVISSLFCVFSLSYFVGSLLIGVYDIQGGPKKRHKVYGTIILEPYITESCGFQQNVQKEILYMTKVSV